MTTKLAKGIVSRDTSYSADPKLLKRRENWNQRFDFGDIAGLKASIKMHGVRRPLEVRRNKDGDLEIVDGDRRQTAVEELIVEGHDIASVPVIIIDKKVDDFTAKIYMLTANDGKPFLPLEEAMAYKAMVDEMGKTPAEIATALGRSEAFVKDRLVLLTASAETQKAIVDGKVGTTIVAEIINKNKDDTAKQDALVQKAGSGKKGKRAVRTELAGGAQVLSAAAIRDMEIKVMVDLQVDAKMLGVTEDSGVEPTDEQMKKFIIASAANAASFRWGMIVALRAARGVAAADASITL